MGHDLQGIENDLSIGGPQAPTPTNRSVIGSSNFLWITGYGLLGMLLSFPEPFGSLAEVVMTPALAESSLSPGAQAPKCEGVSKPA